MRPYLDQDFFISTSVICAMFKGPFKALNLSINWAVLVLKWSPRLPLLWQSEFESRWCLQFFPVKFVIGKNKNK